MSHNKNLKVINLFSGPCGGKSTVAAGLFYRMKIDDYDVELVTEYAKDLVYNQQMDMMGGRQEYIFSEQLLRLWRLVDHVEWAVTDSPLLLSYIYADSYEFKESLRNLIIPQFNTFTNYNFFLQRPTTFKASGRIHDEQQSLEKDQQILRTLRENDTKFTLVSVNHDAVEQIYQCITSETINSDD